VAFNGSSSSDSDGSVVQWQWSFGDGASASGQAVSHSYASAGTYTVTLTVRDDDSATDGETKQITVGSPSLPDLVVTSLNVAPPAAALGETLTFSIVISNQGNAVAGFFRVRLDGSSSSTAGFVWGLDAGASVTVTLTRPLLQSVETFTVTADDQAQVTEANEANNGSQRTVTAVTPPPVADAGGPYSGTANVPLTLTGTGSSGSISSYTWTFGDGSSGQGATVSHTYPAAGSYTATLSVSGPGGQSADSAQVTISPAQAPLSVQLALPKTSYASGDAISITHTLNRGAYVYVCDVDASGAVRLIFPNVYESNAFISAGTRTLPGVAGYSILVGPPTGTETLYAFAAAGPISVFPTSFGSGFPVLSYDPAGFRNSVLQTMQAQYASADRASDTLSFTVTSPPPTTGTLQLTSSPSGASITIDGSPSGTTPAQRTLPAGSHSITLSLSGYQPASFSVAITSGQTTTRSVTLTPIATNQDPVAGFSFSPSSPTVGQTVSFQASSSYDPDGSIATYAWSFGDGTSGNGLSVTHSYSSAGSKTVTLTVTDNQGATDSKSLAVGVGSVTIPEPRAYWRFNEGGGGTAADASGNGNTGVLQGPSWATSVDGSGALSFDGANDFVRAPASTSLNAFATELTVEAWIQPSALGGTQRIVSQDGSGSSDNRFILFTEGNKLRASIYAGDWIALTGTTTLYNGIWYHVAVVYNGYQMILYLNGAREAATSGGGAVGQGQSSAATTIGGKEDGSQLFAGLIDEVRIHGTMLRTTSFLGLPASYVPPTPANQPPVADFTFFPTSPRVGEQVRFDASPSYDPEDGSNLSMYWSFSDGATAIGGKPRRTWDTPGTYTATLKVTDSQGAEVSVTKSIIVSP